MRALLVIDVQNALVEQVDFQVGKENIKKLIGAFKQKEEPVIFIRHTDEDGPLAAGTNGADLDPELAPYADHIVEKHTESAFYQTNLEALLQTHRVDHLLITGFNTEFCCLFTAIAGYDRGYKVAFIEDATSTVHTADNYEMPGLDIRDFIGTVLFWSKGIDVMDCEDWMEKWD